MKNRSLQYIGNQSSENADRSKPVKNKKKRLGGKGLSLEAFARAKSKNNDYNPGLIKKQREYYKNAKYVSKFKKSLKQEFGMQNHLAGSAIFQEEGEETGIDRETKKSKKKNLFSLREEYEKRREEEERARMEREAIIKAKKEEREKAEARRKALKQKMFKKTRSGQPVMKYRIEHILESIQGCTN